LHIENANFAKGYIPRKILLDNTRNIHSYFVFCKYENDFIYSAYWQKENFSKSLIAMITLQYSDLDRPLFIVFRNKENQYNVIEGNELREILLEQPNTDLVGFILHNSVNFNEMIINIKKELLI